jgi:hypothetical protein
MSRRRNRNKANYIKPKDEKIIIDQQTKDEPKPSKSRFILFWNSFSTFWKIIGVLFIIVGGMLSIVQLYDRFFPQKEKSQKEEYDNEIFVKGELNLPKIPLKENTAKFLTAPVIDSLKRIKILPNLDTLRGVYIANFDESNIAIAVGNEVSTMFHNHFYAGVNILPRICSVNELFLKVKDDRLYVSLEFKDLQKEETIGIIEYNHWKLVKDNMFDWKDTDSSIVVWDKQHNVVLSLLYQNSPTNQMIYLNGYFIGNDAVLVLNDRGNTQAGCYQKRDPGWKQKALNNIQTIRAVF